ncbi:MAG: hypothetical protein JNL38_04710 [Myxococcales bacterium]|jgi:opacity protein-like surface antigen|nr:hypothetical protein [Myxococcales bacterium]
MKRFLLATSLAFIATASGAAGAQPREAWDERESGWQGTWVLQNKGLRIELDLVGHRTDD